MNRERVSEVSIPLFYENGPHLNILVKTRGELDVMMGFFDTSGKLNNSLEERAPRGDDLACIVQGTNQRLKLLKCC